MAQQMVLMARRFELFHEKKSELSPETYHGIEEMASPCRDNIDYLINSFPKMPEDIDRKLRTNDELLRRTLNRNYKIYLVRLATKSA
jgi:pyruvate kinase